jgi:hypothetical protein
MRTRQWTTLLALAGLAACGGDFEPPQISIVGIVSSITVDGEPANVTLERGAPPPENAAPVIDATVPVAAINGGSFTVNVTSADQFSEVVIRMPGARLFASFSRPPHVSHGGRDLGQARRPLGVCGRNLPPCRSYVADPVHHPGGGGVQVALRGTRRPTSTCSDRPGRREIFWGAGIMSGARRTSTRRAPGPAAGRTPSGRVTGRRPAVLDTATGHCVQSRPTTWCHLSGDEAQVFSGVHQRRGPKAAPGSISHFPDNVSDDSPSRAAGPGSPRAPVEPVATFSTLTRLLG